MARSRFSPTLIGAFVLGGIVLVIAAVIAAGGGKFFTRKEYAVMHFSGSIYGLQVGAPVVFRGVRLGSVTSIGLVYDRNADRFSIPVLAELEPRIIRGMGDRDGQASARGETLDLLVQRGLRAQLSLQSLLTGQLYIDLDLRPEKAGQLRGGRYLSAVEIPTTSTAIQALKGQLEGLDLRKLLDDVSAIAGSARSVLAGPQLKEALDNVVVITEQVQQLSKSLNGRVGPMADAATATMGDARRAIDRLNGTMDKVGGAADRVGRTAERAGNVLAPDAPLMRDVQRAAAELAGTAAALRQHTAEDSGLVHNADRTLQDLSRAARAVRELADMLERHPEALLRGRRREREPEPDTDSDPDPLPPPRPPAATAAAVAPVAAPAGRTP